MDQTTGYFANIGDVTIASLQTVWYTILQYIPQIIAAIIILIIGWIIASVLGSVVRKLVQFTGVDAVVNRSKLNERFKISSRYSLLSSMVGAIVKWLIIIATLMAAADVLNLPQITEFLSQVLLYVPRAIVAVVILTIGVLVGDAVERLLEGSLQASQLPVQRKKLPAKVAKYAIVVFAIMAALTQLQIVPRLIEIAFGGLVLALALAFGLGGREEASRMLGSIRQQR